LLGVITYSTLDSLLAIVSFDKFINSVTIDSVESIPLYAYVTVFMSTMFFTRSQRLKELMEGEVKDLYQKVKNVSYHIFKNNNLHKGKGESEPCSESSA
jgi:hypothetical protein